MKLRLLFSAAVLAASQLAFASGDMPPKPAACPSVSALKSQPFFMAQEVKGHGFAALSIGKYQTQEQWGFMMAFFKVSNMMEALLEANKALPGVAGNPEPMAIPQQKVWACMYGVRGTSLQAFAVTPLPTNGTLNAMTHLL